MTENDVEAGTITLEVLDTFLVLVSLIWVGSVSLPKAGVGSGPLAWGLAGPALLLLIGGNLLYSAILHDFIKPGGFADHMALKLTGLTVLLICLQPAIVEELFFRYIAFGALHRATGTATTIWLTSVMFAMAHIYNPLGLPYLFVLGVVLGVARRYGGILLPMIMHFLHNFVVLAVEAAR
jgi:membrane protease YdiL (CAAX protease family)